MASPSELVTSTIASAWGRAVSLTDDASARIESAIALTTPAPSAVLPDVVATPTLPAAPAITTVGLPSATALFQSTRTDLENAIVGYFSGFIGTYFPRDDYFTDAMDWVHRAITVGGTGISAEMEQHLWERARSKVLDDEQREQDETFQSWGARRFPTPPAALLHASLMITRTSQNAVSEAAREQAIKSFQTEVDNVRIAVDKAVQLRALALSSAGEYIRVLTSSPQTAASASSAMVDSQARFATTLTEFYRAQIGAVEVPVRVATTNADLKTRTTEANLRAALETLTQRVSAAVASAQMVGTQAAAALNAIHTQASISGNDSTVTNIEG